MHEQLGRGGDASQECAAYSGDRLFRQRQEHAFPATVRTVRFAASGDGSGILLVAGVEAAAEAGNACPDLEGCCWRTLDHGWYQSEDAAAPLATHTRGDLDAAAALVRGVLWRWFAHWKKTRPDMADDCPEKGDLDFLRYIWNFERRDAVEIEA
ncbi:hypothetical protein [Sinorhizobium sp. NFACC03]|uniref:hypothetical protein n=1 Tax=Sinorhizobium sp. NFACC03 TaxID=1566295 RepID=UPI003369F20D